VVSKEEDPILSKLDWAQSIPYPRGRSPDVENLVATGCDLDDIWKHCAAAKLNLTDADTRVLA